MFWLFVFLVTCSWWEVWDTKDIDASELACGETLSAPQGIIESPLFPESYPPELDCHWLVLAPAGHRIRLTSEYFSVEPQPQCLWDYLAISDGLEGEFGQAVYCGSDDLNFFSQSNLTSIFFHSDVSGSDVGFRILYETVAPDNNSKMNCNVTMTTEGVVSSPNFPLRYPPNMDCYYFIQAPPRLRVRLQFNSFHMESSPCDFDKLLVFDGDQADERRLLAVFCGKELPVIMTSETNSLTMRFTSDANLQTSGFMAQILFVLPDDLSGSTAPAQTFNTTTVPMTSSSHQSSVSLTSSTLSTLPSSSTAVPRASSGQPTVSGTSPKQPTVSVTSPSQTPVSVTSPSQSSVSVTSPNQSAVPETSSKQPSEPETESNQESWTTTAQVSTAISITSLDSSQSVEPTTTKIPNTTAARESLPSGRKDCNITITASRTNLSSPGYPQQYPPDMTCVIRLRSSANSTYLLTFTDFSIEEEESCSYDSLSIFTADDGQPHPHNREPLYRLCGATPTNQIFTFDGFGLDLVFRSDLSVSAAGYLAEVVIAPVVQVPRCPAVCENGGSCTEILLADGSVDWKCVCPDQFTGTLCESGLRQTCQDVQCVNNGVCRDDGSTVSCICPSGFSGPFCQQTDQVWEAGSLYFTKMVSNMTLSVGSSLILECAVNDPTAQVMWLYQDLILTSSDWSRGVEVHPGGVVVIPEVEDIHAGRYTCMAVSSDDLVEKSMWIQLQEPCSLHVTKAPHNITIKEGQTAMFQCYVPDADVMLWRKDGDMVLQGPRKRILVNNYLVINPVMETDAGLYTCAARSKNGCFAKVSAYLTVDTMGHGKECGRRRHKPQDGGSGRITSGREAAPGSAPWHVILREYSRSRTFCGGSLISPDTVLTAAHCIGQFEIVFTYPFHPQHIQVFLGTQHCDGHNGIFRQIKSVLLHEHYNNTNYNNDVAILKLDTPVDYSELVLPICLETPEFLEELLRPGHLGTITGCGDTHFKGHTPTFLNEVQIPYVPREICAERASAVRTNFTEGMFCAGYARSMRGDACSGDSGGSFILEFRGRYIQAGIVSWGVGCDRENHYGYYTNIAHYYSWIMDKIK